MHKDVLIIGQGICGTFLSWYLKKEQKSFVVIDNNHANASSRMAAGIINPVTGRRMVTVWMAGEIIPFAWDAYSHIGNELGITAIYHRNIIDFFPNPFMREGFLQKIKEGDQYMHAFPEQNHFNHSFNYDFGCGEIRPVYTVNLEHLLPAWRLELIKNNELLEENFIPDELKVEKDKIQYKEITADKIIFCDGLSSFESPFFKQLPFAPNKGEALVAVIPGLAPHHVYKKSMTMAPMAQPDHFWIGSSYIWDFDNTDPTKEFRLKTEAVLREWLKIPFEVIEHRVGLRPATLERRPFAGFHPVYPAIGILNGMGTKGYSLAPFFAKQLVDNLCYGNAIAPEADIMRFRKLLTR